MQAALARALATVTLTRSTAAKQAKGCSGVYKRGLSQDSAGACRRLHRKHEDLRRSEQSGRRVRQVRSATGCRRPHDLLSATGVPGRRGLSGASGCGAPSALDGDFGWLARSKRSSHSQHALHNLRTCEVSPRPAPGVRATQPMKSGPAPERAWIQESLKV